MNKFLKGCLITVLILIVLGSILGAIGWILGGNRQIDALVRSGELTYGPSDRYFEDWEDNNWDEDNWENDNEQWDERGNILAGEISQTEIASIQDVTSLEIAIGGGQLYIEESEDDKLYIESNTHDKFTYYIKEGKLMIEGLRDNRKLYRANENEIILYIPRELKFAEAEISVGGAFADIKGLRSQELEIMVGAGEVTAEYMEVQDADFKLGAGRLYYEGKINGNLDLECAIGSMNLMLEGTEKEHNYRIDGAIGNIRVGEVFQTGIAMSRNVDNNAASTFRLECGVGNIEIDFFDREEK